MSSDLALGRSDLVRVVREGHPEKVFELWLNNEAKFTREKEKKKTIDVKTFNTRKHDKWGITKGVQCD